MTEKLRNQVFISYSHRDKDWLERFRDHLKPLVRKEAVSVWDDSEIEPGEPWRDAIAGALERTRVALLLVSPDFLASDFIAEHELPQLLEAAEREGLAILWVPIRASSYAETEIGRYQAACDPGRPLAAMNPAEQDEVLVEVCGRVKRAVAAREPQPLQAARLCFARGSPVARTRLFAQPRLVLGRPKRGADLWLALFPLDDPRNHALMDGFSAAHAVLRLEGGAAIRDEGSRSGTEVNGEGLGRSWRPLEDGDLIGFQHGVLVLRVCCPVDGWLRLDRVDNGVAQEGYLCLQESAAIGSGPDAAIPVSEGVAGGDPIAELRREAGGFVIAGRAIGIEINGAAVPAGTAVGLSDGDRVAVGPVSFELAGGAYPG